MGVILLHSKKIKSIDFICNHAHIHINHMTTRLLGSISNSKDKNQSFIFVSTVSFHKVKSLRSFAKNIFGYIVFHQTIAKFLSSWHSVIFFSSTSDISDRSGSLRNVKPSIHKSLQVHHSTLVGLMNG